MDFLSHLIRQGFSIERNYPSGKGNKNCDFKVSKESETLFIELKQLPQFSTANLEVIKLSDLIFEKVLADPIIRSTPIILRIELSKNLREKAKSKEGRADLLNSLELIVKQIRDRIAEKAQNRDWDRHIIPGLAEYEIYPREEKNSGVTGSFAGLPFCEEAEVEKLFTNAIEEAINQLPQERPGVLIVKTPLPLNLEKVERVVVTRFQEDTERFRHLSGVLVVYTYFRERLYYDINFVNNPQAKIDISFYATIKAILSLQKVII